MSGGGWRVRMQGRGRRARIRARHPRPRSRPVRWRRRDSPPYPRACARKSPSPARSAGRAGSPCPPEAGMWMEVDGACGCGEGAVGPHPRPPFSRPFASPSLAAKGLAALPESLREEKPIPCVQRVVGRAVPARQRLGCGWRWMARADAREGGMAASAPAIHAPVRIPFAGGEGTRRPTRELARGKAHSMRAARVGRALRASRLGNAAGGNAARSESSPHRGPTGPEGYASKEASKPSRPSRTSRENRVPLLASSPPSLRDSAWAPSLPDFSSCILPAVRYSDNQSSDCGVEQPGSSSGS